MALLGRRGSGREQGQGPGDAAPGVLRKVRPAPPADGEALCRPWGELEGGHYDSGAKRIGRRVPVCSRLHLAGVGGNVFAPLPRRVAPVLGLEDTKFAVNLSPSERQSSGRSPGALWKEHQRVDSMVGESQ